jgi:TRAP-type mannitol/chloroaromatic compound transport system permease small subunit
MAFWQRIARGIDRLNGWVGHTVAWLTVALVVLGAANAFARYAGRFFGVSLSSNAWLELQWYLFSTLFLLAAAWVLREESHVRVDVLFSRLSARGQAWVNLLGTVLLLVPFCGLTLWVTWPAVRNSWQVREGSPDPGGLARWPLKALIMVCFALLLLQALAEIIKQIEILRRPAAVVPPRADSTPRVEGV